MLEDDKRELSSSSDEVIELRRSVKFEDDKIKRPRGRPPKSLNNEATRKD